MKDRLVIAYDNCPPDVPTLMVARSDKCDMTILKKIQGDKAFEIYCYLTGGADLKSVRDIPMEHHHTKVFCINDKARVSVCPNCLSMIVTHEEEFPNYCSSCGQAIKWD